MRWQDCVDRGLIRADPKNADGILRQESPMLRGLRACGALLLIVAVIYSVARRQKGYALYGNSHSLQERQRWRLSCRLYRVLKAKDENTEAEPDDDEEIEREE